MRERAQHRVAWPLLAVALVPATVVALVAFLQRTKLDVPTLPNQCLRACAETLVTQISDERSDALTFAWAGAVLLLAIGSALAIVLAARLRRERTRALERERAALVRACVNVGDMVSGALREQLTDALADAGVTPIEVPVGEPFDSARHHAVGRVPTSDRARDNLIAQTQRAGYLDHGKRLRYPDVVVFKVDGGLS